MGHGEIDGWMGETWIDGWMDDGSGSVGLMNDGWMGE